MELHDASVVMLKPNTKHFIHDNPQTLLQMQILFLTTLDLFSSARGLEVCACDRVPHPTQVS